MSLLGWIDFSYAHKKKVMTVMDMFKDQGVIDELGLGTIRDSLSDLMFPGTSTIQTRAKYFLIIPWIFQEIEKKNQPDRLLADLEALEIQLVKTLRVYNPGRSMGVIGATLLDANPKRKPSSIYWSGLRTFDILKFSGSPSDYAKYMKQNQANQKMYKRQGFEGEGNVPGDDKDAHHLYQQKLWCNFPSPPTDWKEEQPLELTFEEASFLQTQIVRSQGKSLWAYTLLHKAEEARRFKGIEEFLLIPDLPDEYRSLIQLADDFNKIMKGALIRYNYLIQANRENGWAEKAMGDWENYWEEIQRFDWSTWETQTLWEKCHPPVSTKTFVHRWIQLVKAPNYDTNQGDKLIENREFQLKGRKRARLTDKAVGQKQETYAGISNAEGSIVYLKYRWNTVKTFLNDIQNGLATNVTT